MTDAPGTTETDARPAHPFARLPFYYGWVVVTVAFTTVAIGVSIRTSFSLLYPPILAEFGWDRGVTAGIFSVGFLASMLMTPFFGVWINRWGPGTLFASGAVLVSVGLILFAFSTIVGWAFYGETAVTYLFGTGAGFGVFHLAGFFDFVNRRIN